VILYSILGTSSYAIKAEQTKASIYLVFFARCLANSTGVANFAADTAAAATAGIHCQRPPGMAPGKVQDGPVGAKIAVPHFLGKKEGQPCAERQQRRQHRQFPSRFHYKNKGQQENRKKGVTEEGMRNEKRCVKFADF
jgi:hypothetical protein